MCGRFTRYLPWSEIVQLYRLTLDYEINKNTAPAYNIAPTVVLLRRTLGAQQEAWHHELHDHHGAGGRARESDPRRMPVILDQAACDAWLDPTNTAPKQVLSQNLNGNLEFYRAGRQVNSSKYEGADCINPINPL
jgi:putative SOS response-associated peptidase YedK